VGQRCALTFADRVEISTGRKAGWGIRQIAKHLASNSRPHRRLMFAETSPSSCISACSEQPASDPQRDPRHGGDIRGLCDLFGLSVGGATRYFKTVEHPDLTTPGEWVPRT
jgi:hypothetical protein